MASNKSFLPEDYLQKKIATRTNAICVTLFFLVMVGVLAAYFVTDRQRGEVLKLRAEVDAEYHKAALRIDQVEQLQKDKKVMAQREKVAEVLVERIARSVILAELTNMMPSTLSLLEFDMNTKVLSSASRPMTALQREAQKNQKNRQKLAEPEAPVVKPTELTLKLIGVAPTDLEVSEYLAVLNQHELFYDVFLRYSEVSSIQDRKVRKFEISMKLNQDISPSKLGMAAELEMDPMGDTVTINEQGQRVLNERKAQPVSNVDTRKER